MFDTPATEFAEFPFVAEMPKREKSRLAKVWDAFEAVRQSYAENGIPVAYKAAATLLEISHQRVDQLCESGKLKRVEFGGHRYVTEKSLIEFARSERKTGRPQKVIDQCASSPLAAFKVSRGISP